MLSRAVRPWPVALLGVNLVFAVGSVVLSAGREAGFDTAFYAINALALGVAGLLIMCYRRAHPIGTLLTILGIQAGFVELAEGYGYHHAWPGALTATWVSVWASFLGIGGLFVVLAVFPDGHSPSRRWRPVVWAGVAGIVFSILGSATGHAFDRNYVAGVNPHLVAGPLPEIAYVAGQCAMAVALLGSIASLFVRYRRSDPEQRTQLAWLMWALALLVVIGPLALFLYEQSVLVQWLIGANVVLIPIAICIAIVRHRLYDIDVIVSRTVVYAALSAVLVAAWLLTAWFIGVLLGGRHPAWVTAAATVAACALVLPVRRRLQDVVDRRFRRARHDALARIDTYVEALRTDRAQPEDLPILLRDVLDLPQLRIRYVLPDDVRPDADELTRRTVARAGVDLAVVEFPGPAPQLLDDVLDRAGLAIEIGRLRAEVAHQLAEVSRSRERLVAAGYEERRRLERDLHDGAQQRLVSVGLALRHAQHQLGPSPVVPTLEEAVHQVAAAIRELREIARGVRPAGLDHGLAVALRELAGRTPIPVHLDLTADRCLAELEATAYFVASEALTNAVKHSRATAVRLSTERHDASLTVCISDDGVGGADPTSGSGLRGLGDRVAALGGDLHLASPLGSGTTLTARLPCGS